MIASVRSELFSESSAFMDPSISSYNGRVLQLNDNSEEIKNPGDVLLKDLDTYLEDINNWLTISRMVSDSVIQGMICAVEQEAAEKVAQKDLEMARLKEMLQVYHVGADINRTVSYSVMAQKPKEGKCELKFSHSDFSIEHDRVGESLGNLKVLAKEQLKMLKREIDRIKGSTSIRRKGSCSELLGLSGILQEELPDKWIGVDKTLEALRTTLNTVCKKAEDMVHWSKSSFIEWQQERDFCAEVEEMVIENCFRCVQEDFERRLRDKKSLSCSNGNANRFLKIKEVSSLREELDAISKSLFVPESGQLVSHASLESRKVSANHVSSTSLSGMENMPESLDLAQLKHMSKDAMANYFRTEMTEMKRQHESKVQEMTEEIFSLKREYFKEKGSSLPVKKDKELDVLRKKIPEVISKLDNILVGNEFSNNAENLGNLKYRLEALHSENRQLRDLLSDRKKEIESLSSQVSDASDKLLGHSLVQENLSKVNADLKSDLEDAHIESSISADIYKLLLKDLLSQIKSYQDSDIEYDIMKGIYEVIFREVTHNDVPTKKMEIEDLDMESVITQGLCGIIYREAFIEAEDKLNNLNKVRLSLEMQALEKEKELRSITLEKEKLEQQILLLRGIIDEKEKLVQEGANVLAKEKEKFEFASQELEKLRVQITRLLRGLSEAFTDFECKAAEDIGRICSRLEYMSSQLSSLITSANELRRMGLQYKQRLERRCSDLLKAEAEVDLLGDEVETLLGLLEKIYMALDHYSPILQHYPGIIEILKLIRREISGESIKPVRSACPQGNLSS